MRDSLIELLCNIECKGEDFRNGGCALRKDERCFRIDNLDMCMIGCIADNLLANGVIVPPCKVGDKVFGVVPKYDVAKGRVKYKVSDIEIKGLTYRLPDGVWASLLLVVDEKYEQCGTFGKTVFLTREEAEKALAERSGE